MKISSQTEAFVLHFGEMGSRWGFNRTVGQILALIVISESPLCADELVAALNISRGNVSMGIKELQSWQLVKRVHQQGDRKEYFRPAGNVWDMAIRVLEERRKRELDPTITLLRGILMESNEQEPKGHALQQMEEIHNLLEMVTTWSGELQKLQPENLQSLMKLGSGINKVLEFKGKLLK